MKKNNHYLIFVLLFLGNLLSCQKDPEICHEPILRGPYLQIATPTSIIIKWKSCFNKISKVRFGNSPTNLSSVYLDNNSVREHEVKLAGLQPDTKYFYTIETENQILQGDSNNYFITPPLEGTPKKTRIWAIGDFGTGTAAEDLVRDSYKKISNGAPADVWLWLGDNAYSRGEEEEYKDNVFKEHYEQMLKNTCVWPTPGNHDYANCGYLSHKARKKDFPYFDIFTLPQSGETGGEASGSEHYYSFNQATIHFISLDSYGSYNEPGSDMYEWLKRDLASNKLKWTIVTMHHPPYSKGSHDSDAEKELIKMRENILPLLEQYKVDLVLSGHSHVYERSYLLQGHYGNSSTFDNTMKVVAGNGTFPNVYTKNYPDYKGTVYAVVGCSGQSDPNKALHPAMVTTIGNVHGSMIVDVEGNSLTAKFIDKDSQVRDEFTIVKQ